MTPPWYVITGGPCAGKTALVEKLARRGYQTVNEAARTYIESEQQKGRTLADIRKDEIAFQRTLLSMKVATEQGLSKDETLFFDRGMHDSIAYFTVAGVTDDAELNEAVRNTSYRKAFLPDLLPLVADNARTEDPEKAAAIHELLYTAYTEAGIPVVRIPMMSIEERVAFILANL